MPSRQVVIGSRIGLHGRPAAMVVRTAAEQPVPIMISKDGAPVNADSILSVLGLGARGGDVVTIAAEGDGADAALDTLAALLVRDLDAESADA